MPKNRRGRPNVRQGSALRQSGWLRIATPKPSRLQNSTEDSHRERRVVDIRIPAHQHHVDGIPPSSLHLGAGLPAGEARGRVTSGSTGNCVGATFGPALRVEQGGAVGALFMTWRKSLGRRANPNRLLCTYPTPLGNRGSIRWRPLLRLASRPKTSWPSPTDRCRNWSMASYRNAKWDKNPTRSGLLMLYFVLHFVREHGLGLVNGAQGSYQAFPDDPDKVRIPYVSFTRRDRLPNDRPSKGHGRVAPDLVVEVTSPNDSFPMGPVQGE